MRQFMDPVFLVSIVVLAGSLYVLAKALPVWLKSRALEAPPSPEPSSPPPEPSTVKMPQTELQRLTDTVGAMQLGHAEAMQLLAGRLDRMESAIQELSGELKEKLKELETKIKDEPDSQSDTSSLPPPPFV